MNEIIKLLDKTSAVEAINKLGEEDLRYLNRMIVDRINYLTHLKRKSQLRQFIPGDRVRFKTPYGEEKSGTVIRVNQKTVSVSTGESEGWWKISPGLLTLEERG
ncbi:MAG: hypothetical protein JXA71_05975 [Chitinispirillaceae bacterium]|nr:hypothetical protein [Chitinispirillaceae bacterium]